MNDIDIPAANDNVSTNTVNTAVDIPVVPAAQEKAHPITEDVKEIVKEKPTEEAKNEKETKLKLKMSDNKGKINHIYEEIGKKVYEKQMDREECVQAFEEYKKNGGIIY